MCLKRTFSCISRKVLLLSSLIYSFLSRCGPDTLSYTRLYAYTSAELIYLLPALQYSMTYPSMPPAPIFSGGRHLSVQVESVTSSTVRRVGSLVGAERDGDG